MAAPACSARRERSAQMCEAKCVVVTMTGTRPATCFEHGVEHRSRSASVSTNCSEKLARMHSPVRAGVDHEVDGTLLAVEIEPAVAVEHRRHDRETRLYKAAERWKLP